MPAALRQLLSKGDVKTVSTLFNQQHQRRRQELAVVPGGPGARKASHRLPQTFAAYIITTETRVEADKHRSKYTTYKVLVSNGPSQTWVVRRYSDFHQLHLQIQKQFPKKKLPAFPAKRLLGNNFSSHFVLARREQLNQYLAGITGDPEIRSWETVRWFFTHQNYSQVPEPTPSLATSQLPAANRPTHSDGGRFSFFSALRNQPDRGTEPGLRRSTSRAVDPSRGSAGSLAAITISGPDTSQSIDRTETLKRRTFTMQSARKKLGLLKRKDLAKKRRVHHPPSGSGSGSTSHTPYSTASKHPTGGVNSPVDTNMPREPPLRRPQGLMGLDGEPDGSDAESTDDPLVDGTSRLAFPNPGTTIDDFTLLKVIGKGSYGKVGFIAEGLVYAIKVLSKQSLRQRPHEIVRVMAERSVLERSVNHPFLVGLRYAFQTQDNLYFCIDYVNGGELFIHLQRDQRFEEDRARFYAAEITLALGHLHALRIVYRDLKPENCLLDAHGHIRLVDFGLSKDMTHIAEAKTATFCGTPEYLAPEILSRHRYDHAVDWYCLGAVLYEMLVGLPPFFSRDTGLLFQGILHGELNFPDHVSDGARHLISRLMDRNPATRLGEGPQGTRDVQAHPFFDGIDWKKLYAKEISPPYNPDVAGTFDLKHIDPAFSAEPVPQSVLNEGTVNLGELYEGIADRILQPDPSAPTGYLDVRARLDAYDENYARRHDSPHLGQSTPDVAGLASTPNHAHVPSNTTHGIQARCLNESPAAKRSPAESHRSPRYGSPFDMDQALDDTDRAFRGFSFMAPSAVDSDSEL
ncbi:Serine/threonine-protein kinase Sgk2 [Tieghemiomyces parasiticus]|uniref:Serine/threonine-protein kinase Sgk2 n=1 Tax=Tieghemiomyces parasiticus TaxID=78921 RepID=A0A9W8DVS9_9FUNG|nr:Serine/threonine-protein kinase Sgk2 [Tieghemiomyces parasiticus]